MNQEQQTTNSIKVPNKNMEVLNAQFPQCFTKDGQFDLEKFKQELATAEVDFYKESYGLDWLGKSYARLLASDEATTLLREDEAHNQKPENKASQNLLLKGDNLEVLKHLSNAYYEKVKMIYIDPPYNTGSDGFVYADDRKFTVQELQQLAGVDEEKARRILEFTRSKSNSHSAWLTFMYPRLYIAKQLLREDGVIFISIDDNEVAQLRLVMDEIFGEENFVATLIWERAYSPKNDAKFISNSHDYVVMFAKSLDKFQIGRLSRTQKANERYANPDNDPRGVWKPSDISVKTYNAENDYPITTPSGRIVEPPAARCWSLSKKAFFERLQDDRIWFGTDGNSVPSIKRFLSELKFDGMAPTSILFYKEVGHSQEGAKEVVSILGGEGNFDGPKPTRLLKRLLTLSNLTTDSIILDFFAGSGSSGDAVMQLNAEDGVNRKYVLVQLPEALDKKKDKTAYDFVKNELGVAELTIFEITKERLIRAAKKVKEETIATKLSEKQKELAALDGTLDLDGKAEKTKLLKAEIEALKNQDLGFRIFETMPIWEDYGLEADELDKQMQLFDESKLTTEDLKALLITWKTNDGLPLTQDLEAIDLGGYTAHLGKDKLYLMAKGFTTDHLKALLEKLDADKTFSPATIIAFSYYFESKSLREIAENVKSYANKKSTDIDFITRY